MPFYNFGYRLIGSPDGLPLPPGRLVELVVGTREVACYQLSGLFSHECLVVFLRRNAVDINALQSIYDFGCGCGRIVRWLVPLKDHCEIWGTDYNPDLAEWCDKNLGSMGRFKVNGPTPPLDFESEKFDLVHSYSVFTHIRRDQQLDWLKELVRVTKRLGYLVITTQGRRIAWRQGFPEWMFNQLMEEGIYAAGEDHSGTNRCSVFHTDRYFKDISPSLGLQLVDFMEGAARDNSEQDYYLFRRIY